MAENKSKSKGIKTSVELAQLLELSSSDAIEIEFRAKIVKKISEAVDRHSLTHAAVAQVAHTSRTRVTAILNGNITGISTDLLLRLLYSLGFRAEIRFKAIRLVA